MLNQGFALTEPDGPWQLTFAFVFVPNLNTGHPQDLKGLEAMGSQTVFLEHSEI